MASTSPEGSSLRLRLSVLLVVIVCLFSALFARLWFLQVINAKSARAVASENGVETVYIPAPRGEILDANGNLLVGNVEQQVVEVNRQVAADNPQMVRVLAPLLDMTTAQLDTAVDNLSYSPYAPVPVKVDATPQQVLYIDENPTLFPGVTTTTMSVPFYTAMGLAAANIVGYVGPINATQYKALKSKGYQANEDIGQSGIEETYESVLHGKPGVAKVQVDSQGDVLSVISETAPVPGLNLRLSINGKIQEAAIDALQHGLLAARSSTHDGVPLPAPAASAVVEDPQNGTIVALATDPDYDPRWFQNGLSQAQSQYLSNPANNQPELDRAIQGEYAPGSTFKLVTATAGLQYGVITPSYTYDDTGSITVGGQTFTNDDYESYGPVALTKAIIVSDDNFFNRIGGDLYEGAQYPANALQDVADEYGFNSPTGIALPGESAGYVLTPQTKAELHAEDPTAYPYGTWYTGDSVQTAIGQDDVVVTPLQLANAYSTFANGATLWEPRLVEDSQTAAGKIVTVYDSTERGRVTMSAPDRAAMLAGFEGVVQNPLGTAYGIFTGALANDDIAGKTGTAQVTGEQSTSIFTSFAPATDPQYEVTAVLEQAGYGADVAGPVVREIYDALYNLPLQTPTVVEESGAQN